MIIDHWIQDHWIEELFFALQGEKIEKRRSPGNLNQSSKVEYYPSLHYMFEVNDRNTRKRCETCSKLTIKISERLCNIHRKTTCVGSLYLIKLAALLKRDSKTGVFLWILRRRSVVFIVNFKHISHLFLVFLLLTLNK